MFVKILGIVDIVIAAILFLIAIDITIPIKMLIFLIVVLAVKSIPNLSSFCIASIIDFVVVIVLIACIFTMPSTLLLLVAAFVIAQKGVMSFL